MREKSPVDSNFNGDFIAKCMFYFIMYPVVCVYITEICIRKKNQNSKLADFCNMKG